MRVEIKGHGEVRLERLTAMAALDTKLVLNVPHSKLLYGRWGRVGEREREREREKGREREK